MNRRPVRILLALVVTGLAWWCCTLHPLAQMADPAKTIQAYYEALQACDYQRAAAFVPGLRDNAAAGHVVADMVTENPRFGKVTRRAVYEGCSSNLRNIGTALEMYSTDNSGRYPHAMALLTPNYLKAVPTCPTAHRDTYSTSYQWTAHPDAYTVVCAGLNHGGAGLPADHPRYTGTEGLVLGAAAKQDKAAPAWIVASFKILPARIQGGSAMVPVEEVYTIHGMATRVEVEFPLQRGPRGWFIDFSKVKLPDLASPDVGLTWYKSHGLGYTVAARISQVSPTDLVKSCRANLELLASALDDYASDHAGKYPQALSELKPDYVEVIPACKAAGGDHYTPGYARAPDGKSCIVSCQGTNHVPLGPDCPRFTSGKGVQDTP